MAAPGTRRASSRYVPRSRQFGRTSAPMVPHFVQIIFGRNDGTVRSAGRWSTFMIISCRHWWHWIASDRTPLARMLPRSIGSIGSLKRERAIGRLA
jgi:hypothetical protein